MILVGIDDTDMPETRGTNRLALAIAEVLPWPVLSVTKHPHLQDPRIPFTHHNHSVVLEVDADDPVAVADAMEREILADFIPGSDPGLCVAVAVPAVVRAFGERSLREILDPAEARALAARGGLILRGLGGTELGVIGALAGVGQRASGGPGACLRLAGRTLDDQGRTWLPDELRALGVHHLVDAGTGDALPLLPLHTERRLRPLLMGGAPVVHARYKGGRATYVRHSSRGGVLRRRPPGR